MDIQTNNANERVEETPMAGSGAEMSAAAMIAEPRAMRPMGTLGRVCRALGLATIVGGSMLMASCHSAVTEGRSSVYLIMESLEGGELKQGDQVEFFHQLRSDVRTKGGIVEDPGRVVMRIAFKDVTNPNAPTTNNFVTVNRYRVEYRRADGRNRQGQDVPYAFDGAATFTVTDQSTEGGFVLVRVQSKLEPPLTTMEGNGGAIVISTLADVTFWGRDQTGTEVSVKGTISVNFSDWADPES